MDALSKVGYYSSRNTSERTQDTSLSSVAKTFATFFDELKQEKPETHSTEFRTLMVKRLEEMKQQDIQRYVDVMRSLFWMEFLMIHSEEIARVLSMDDRNDESLETVNEFEKLIALLNILTKFLKFDDTMISLGNEFLAKN